MDSIASRTVELRDQVEQNQRWRWIRKAIKRMSLANLSGEFATLAKTSEVLSAL